MTLPTSPKSLCKSTNSMILDYLFYQSIQAQLQNAKTKDDFSPKDKNAIQSVISTILSSSASSLQMNSKFEQRLNLFQLTNLVFGGTDHVPSPLSTKRSNKREVNSDLSDFFSTSIPYFCRKHRLPNCNQSDCLSQKPKEKTNPRNPGLLEAIPTFLKISASMLRSVLDGDGDVKPLTVAGQQVMGGGMPPRWYDLFLELLTQAVIQCYLCDGHTGPETVSDAFSYGYVEDEDEEEDDDDADDEEDDDEEEESLDNRDIKAADHHLLFPKTRTMYLFKVQVREREKEFIRVDPKTTLLQHFENLSKVYPLEAFEKNMSDFIKMLLEDMDIPALDKCDLPDIASPIKSPEDSPELQFISTIPPLYKYPEDGSLLMPEIPDIHDDESVTVIPTSSYPGKRSASTAELDDEDKNEKRSCH